LICTTVNEYALRISLLKKKYAIRIFFSWAIIASIFSVLITHREHFNQEEELTRKATILHRMASQKADQHDAHLSALSVIASSSDVPQIQMFENLSETIRKFYTHVKHVELFTLDVDEKPTLLFTTRQQPLSSVLISKMISFALSSNGKIQILPYEQGYFLLKRSPNNDDARYGVALFIDAEGLLENGLNFAAETRYLLSSPNGIPIFNSSPNIVATPDRIAAKYTATLSSRSQPLRLEVTQHGSWTEYIPLNNILLFAIFSSLGAFFIYAFLMQKFKIRQAEERAILRENEARIAKASRINGLGEMASGLAHEMTQPLTAILSQSQAGVRVIQSSDANANIIEEIFFNISKQAKRGGELTKRFRDWTTHAEENRETFNLNSVATGIHDLIQTDLKERDIFIKLDLTHDELPIYADQISIEQVIFNLTRNSIEALDGVKHGLIEIATKLEGNFAIITVQDNGHGIAEEDMIKLYQPFFSTKKNGMGLGLSLCESIIQRYNGQIEIINNEKQGVSACVTFPLKKTL
jgi:signal transduction histidine kinase